MCLILGGFHYDSSSIEIYSPEYLLMEDVIIVTINYRLNLFGFLCLPSVGVYGNAGLKDQQMALQWVYDNISNFGGDPDNICVFGESAGAASVHLHVLNRSSRKIMKSAIMQSGCALGDWVFQKNPSFATRNLARHLGCPIDDDQEMFKYIMAASKEELVKYLNKTQDYDEQRRNLRLTFKPVIEVESEEAFITSIPAEIIKSQGHEINIPLMFGTNDIDGISMTVGFLRKLKEFNNDYVRLLPMSLKVDPNSEHAREVSKKIKNFYFCDETIGENSIKAFIDHSTDYYFLLPQTIANELHAKFNRNCKQYLYEFRFDGKFNHYKTLMGMGHIPGAAHADELGYIFRQRIVAHDVDVNSREMKMVRKMCKLWTNFAKYHEPTLKRDSLQWAPTTDPNELKYLIIDDELKTCSDLHKNRLDFWRKVYRSCNNEFVTAKL